MKYCFDKRKKEPAYKEIQIGDKMLRRNHNYPDEPDQWIEFTVNETYLELMNEFPNDFRTIGGDKIFVV